MLGQLPLPPSLVHVFHSKTRLLFPRDMSRRSLVLHRLVHLSRVHYALTRGNPDTLETMLYCFERNRSQVQGDMRKPVVMANQPADAFDEAVEVTKLTLSSGEDGD